MNQQLVFDTVRFRLLLQEKQCTDGDGNCLYFGTTGLRCAIGWLIREDRYNGMLEGESIESLIEQRVLGEEFGEVETTEDMKLLQELQDLHDSNPPMLWDKKFRDLASVFHLTV